VRAHRMGLSPAPLGAMLKGVIGALAFVCLASVAVAAPVHMLSAGFPDEPVTPAIAAWDVTDLDRTGDHGTHGAAGHTGTLDAGHSNTGDLPEVPHEHGADCLACGLLPLPGTQTVASVAFQVPGGAEAVLSPRGLALSDRAVVNPRLRGPPVT
jgi:hypothetical protein